MFHKMFVINKNKNMYYRLRESNPLTQAILAIAMASTANISSTHIHEQQVYIKNHEFTHSSI